MEDKLTRQEKERIQNTIDIAVAQEKLAEVEQLSAKLVAAEGQLETGYAKLAFLLKEVSENRYWKGTYKNFGEFLSNLQEKFQLGKSQLYNYLSTAKELPQLGEGDLNTMGISKALVLRNVRATSGHDVPESLVKQALDPEVTVKDLKKMLYDSGTLTKPEEGTWHDFDLSGYYTDEEWETVKSVLEIAKKVDPPIDERKTEHVQRKEIFLRMAMEFIGTWEAETYGR